MCPRGRHYLRAPVHPNGHPAHERNVDGLAARLRRRRAHAVRSTRSEPALEPVQREARAGEHFDGAGAPVPLRTGQRTPQRREGIPAPRQARARARARRQVCGDVQRAGGQGDPPAGGRSGEGLGVPDQGGAGLHGRREQTSKGNDVKL